MALVKKVDPNWQPSENPDLPVGGIIEMTNPQTLVDAGIAVYCDDNGNEIIFPGLTKYEYPVVLKNTQEAQRFVKYFLSPSGSVLEEETEEEEEDPEPEFADMETVAPTPVEEVAPVITGMAIATEAPKAYKDMTKEEQKAWRIANLQKAREAKKANG